MHLICEANDDGEAKQDNTAIDKWKMLVPTVMLMLNDVELFLMTKSHDTI